VGYIFLNNRQ